MTREIDQHSTGAAGAVSVGQQQCDNVRVYRTVHSDCSWIAYSRVGPYSTVMHPIVAVERYAILVTDT